MRIPLLLLGVLLVAAPPLQAQDTTAARARDTTASRADDDVTVLEVIVTPGTNERHTVFLQKGVLYRARFDGPGITIRMRSRTNRRLPFVVNVTPVPDVERATEFELYPDVDGDVEMTPYGEGLETPLRFRIWRDVRGAERRERMAGTEKLAFGVEGTFGAHGSYGSTQVVSAGEGVNYGACLAMRHGPASRGRFSGCLIGIEGMTGGAAGQHTTLFVEPRFMLIRRSWGPGLTRTDLGVVARLGQIRGDQGSLNEMFFGLGFYGAQDITLGEDGSGWRGMVSLRFDGITRSESVGTPPQSGTKTHLYLIPVLQAGIGRFF